MTAQPDRQHLNLRVRGVVQGVCFRACACEQARRLGIAGFVRNEPDGSVMIEAEGAEAGVAAFTAWCRQGPLGAVVDEMGATPGPLKNYHGFGIRYS